MIDPSREVLMEAWQRRIDYLLGYSSLDLAELMLDLLAIAVARGGSTPHEILTRLLALPDEELANPDAVAAVKDRIAQLSGES